MIAIIDGKRYDTDKAELIFEKHNGRSTDDFHYRCYSLYRTKAGAWFLHHEGGALTDMAVPIRGGSGGSAKIEPLTPDQAFEWLQEYGQYEDAVEAMSAHFRERVTDA